MLKDGILKNGLVEYNGKQYTIPESFSLVDRIIGNTFAVKEQIKQAGFKWDSQFKVWINPEKYKWLKENCMILNHDWVLIVSGEAKEIVRGIIDIDKNRKESRISRFELDGDNYEVWQHIEKANQYYFSIYKNGEVINKSIRFFEKMLARLEG
ncbi:hypothetical protein KIAC18_000320 [Sporomusa sphaeroides]|uniref:hypothetical protein n=1 Tax=Sporomusa sphaeroides TaxID=47679 RepID=UPI003DA1B1F1